MKIREYCLEKMQYNTHSVVQGTGCSLNIVYFWNILNIPDSGLSLLSLGVGVCTHTRQVENQRCSGTDRVQKNLKF